MNVLKQKSKIPLDLYEFITENANDLIGIITKTTRYEYINKKACKKFLGYESYELVGSRAIDFIHPDDFSRVFKTINDGKNQGEAEVMLRFKHKNGHWVWLEIRGKWFVDINGTSKGLLIARDITDRKLAEQKLKESEKQYRDSYKRAEFYKDLFTHDVLNIFQVIYSSIDLFKILNKNLRFPKESGDLLNLVKEQTKRGNRLISNVRTLSKLEDAKIGIKPMEIYQILGNSIKYVKNSFYYKDIRINFNFIKHEIYVFGNELLADVFENVLINAVKYNANEIIEIYIKISRIIENKRIYIKMEFNDNGIGIQDSLKEHIFKRGTEEKKGGKGMGLGLSIVFKILKEYGGRIWVEDRIKGDYTKGSNFILILPEAEKALS